jgi:hypothetical protein
MVVLGSRERTEVVGFKNHITAVQLHRALHRATAKMRVGTS